MPAGLPRSLVLLHLEKNAIRSVDAEVLTPIRNLEYLLLHSNQLQAPGIHPLAFQGLKRLHTVHLYNNALERVPSGLPRRVRTLMMLHNQITGIGRDDFATTYFLEELNLSYNRITSPQVHRDAFRKLRQLRSLDLSGNRLQTLPQGLPRNVHVLKVKRNELAALARGSLAGMAQLRELFLTGNRLRNRALGTRAWADLEHLQVREKGLGLGAPSARGGQEGSGLRDIPVGELGSTESKVGPPAGTGEITAGVARLSASPYSLARSDEYYGETHWLFREGPRSVWPEEYWVRNSLVSGH